MNATVIATIISGSVTAIVTWVLARYKNSNERKGQELINVKTLIEISNKTIEELRIARNEITNLTNQVKELTDANIKLNCEVQLLRRLIRKKTSPVGKKPIKKN